MVERNLAKVEVASSNLVSRSIFALGFMTSRATDPGAAQADTDGYAEWNPIFVNVMGVMQTGKEVILNIKLEDGQTSRVTVTVKAMQPHRSIQQSWGVSGILTAHHDGRF